jgi:putative endonuclease
LYTGVTSDIWFRVLDHKLRKRSGFTKKYNVTRLIYYEETSYIYDALAREKEIKGWSRKKKIDLVKSINPQFVDLATEWYSEEDFI